MMQSNLTTVAGKTLTLGVDATSHSTMNAHKQVLSKTLAAYNIQKGLRFAAKPLSLGVDVSHHSVKAMEHKGLSSYPQGLRFAANCNMKKGALHAGAAGPTTAEEIETILDVEVRPRARKISALVALDSCEGDVVTVIFWLYCYLPERAIAIRELIVFHLADLLEGKQLKVLFSFDRNFGPDLTTENVDKILESVRPYVTGVTLEVESIMKSKVTLKVGKVIGNSSSLSADLEWRLISKIPRIRSVKLHKMAY